MENTLAPSDCSCEALVLVNIPNVSLSSAVTHLVGKVIGIITFLLSSLPSTAFSVTHCLMSDSNPAPEYYIFYITGVDAAGIGIERFTA